MLRYGDQICGRLLAVKFRVDKGGGRFLGGPFYYIENGMGKKWKWLGKLFAFFACCAGALGIGTITQVNGIASATKSFFDPNNEHMVPSSEQSIPGLPLPQLLS